MITNADIPEIKRLYTVERLSLDAVGSRYDVSGASILYWLRKGGIATRKVGSPKQQFKVTPKHRQSAARKGFMSQASIAAQEFRQPLLSSFPESPQLQADFDAIMAGVRAERGTPWTAGIGSISDRAGR